MKPIPAVSFALFLGSMTLLAQSSGRNATKSAVANVAPSSAHCPVEILAQRQTGQGEVAFTDGRRKGIAQKLHLTFSNPKFSEIVGVQITVHGLSSELRLSPAQTAQTDSSEMKKTFELKLRVGPQAEASTDVFLPQFTSVRSIDLDSVSYAGGSKWRSSTGHTCHIVPEGAMLISRR